MHLLARLFVKVEFNYFILFLSVDVFIAYVHTNEKQQTISKPKLNFTF